MQMLTACRPVCMPRVSVRDIRVKLPPALGGLANGFNFLLRRDVYRGRHGT
jgi:hypothetical protein